MEDEENGKGGGRKVIGWFVDWLVTVSCVLVECLDGRYPEIGHEVVSRHGPSKKGRRKGESKEGRKVGSYLLII